jgi:hypothetical protein
MPSLGPPFDTAQDALEAAIAITNDAAASAVLSGQSSATNGSPNLSWVSGPPFTSAMQGLGVSIGGTTYRILTVSSPTAMVLTTNFAGTSGTVSWLITPSMLTGAVLNPATNPAVWPLMNHCYRELEDEFLRLGVETFTETADLIGLEPSQAPLRRTTLYVNWDGYFDGSTVNPDITLPDDLLEPLELWECPNGSDLGWAPMKSAPDSLAPSFPGTRFRQWEWSQNQLNLPQCTITMDLHMRYLAYAPDIVDGTTVLVIPHSKTALAYRVAAAAAMSRGGLEISAAYKQSAKEAEGRIASRTARREDYSRFQRKPFRGAHRGQGRGRGMWAAPSLP